MSCYVLIAASYSHILMALSSSPDGAKQITRSHLELLTYIVKNTAVVYSSMKLTESVSISHPSFACTDV